MDDVTRRALLAATATGGIATATAGFYARVGMLGRTFVDVEIEAFSLPD